MASSEGWRTRSGFMLATIGSAIGVGSIWKFPYEVGANGGGAFVFVYLFGLAVVVVPLMLAEFAIGNRGRADAATSVANVARESSLSERWGLFGLLGAVTAFLILSFYAVVVARGVQRGIETTMKILMPVMMAVLIVLAWYSMRNGDAAATLRFLFVPDTDDLTGRGVLDALGLGFFSIGVGLGILMTYAAYSPTHTDLKQVAIVSVVADTAVSLVAGLAVFPMVFANGLDAASGPGLVFESLPVAFATMPAGRIVAAAFFLLLSIAALGSAVSMLEAAVAVLRHRLGWGRQLATAVAASTCFVAGLATVLSFNHWNGVHLLSGVERYSSATIYDLLDDATSQLLLPLGGLALSMFAGWALPKRILGEELSLRGAALSGLRLMLQVVAPLAIVAAVVVSALR